MSTKTITVMPRKLIQDTYFTKPTAIISIRSPGGAKTDFSSRGPVLKILRLEFSDSTPEEGVRRFARGEPLPEGFVVRHFDAHDAAWSAKHAEAHFRDANLPLFIHCLGGISRSTALAQALGEFYGAEIAHVGPYWDPNPHVYKVMHDYLRRDMPRDEFLHGSAT